MRGWGEKSLDVRAHAPAGRVDQRVAGIGGGGMSAGLSIGAVDAGTLRAAAAVAADAVAAGFAAVAGAAAAAASASAAAAAFRLPFRSNSMTCHCGARIALLWASPGWALP